MSDNIEGRVTKKLSQEFSGTESRILGPLSKLVEFLLDPQVWTCSAIVTGRSWNNNSENLEPTGDRFLNHPYPEVEFSVDQASTSADSDQELTSQRDNCVTHAFVYWKKQQSQVRRQLIIHVSLFKERVDIEKHENSSVKHDFLVVNFLLFTNKLLY